MLSSSPVTKVSSPVDLSRFGIEHISDSISIDDGGRTGGSLYISFFWVTNRIRYSADVFGNPVRFEAASFSFSFFFALLFASASAIVFHPSRSFVDASMTVSQSFVSDAPLSVRLCRLKTLIDFVK